MGGSYQFSLLALGFKLRYASAMVRKVPAEGKSREDIIRLALQSVGK
jgi:Holliday junction resolvasome RuvABC DNA-binding subunit